MIENSNFIHNIIDKDNEEKVYGGEVYTRFPPEPNGHLHIGHAKSICLNFSTAQKYSGKCNLRYDDTNPVKEDIEFVKGIEEDVTWLGFKWDKRLWASDYFEQMYEAAVQLIKNNKAYVCDLGADEIREYRGTLKTPGKESPYRNRTVEENLDLFNKMKLGHFSDGEKVLRAKIDMNSPNMNMRDPVIYRIARATHHNTGDDWCIYPMYDYAHPIEDAIEGITHSICTLEFEDHRPLYDWTLREIGWWNTPPKQIEFARLNLTNTVMSKRYLKKMVDDNIVDGWDDPRMPTISGLRRRGYTPESIRDFCDRIGVAKANSTVDMGLLEYCIREDLKLKVESRNVIENPIKIVITNYDESTSEDCIMENNKEVEEMGNRTVPFSREIYIDGNDFMEVPIKKYFRLFPGNEVRLKGAFLITCNDVIKNEDGSIKELHCTYDSETKSGSGFSGRKVKGTIHWVDAKTAVKVKIRNYDYLMIEELDESGEPTGEFIENANTLEEILGYGEASLIDSKKGERFQFFRHGYYVADTKDHKKSGETELVFNKIVGLKSSFKIK